MIKKNGYWQMGGRLLALIGKPLFFLSFYSIFSLHSFSQKFSASIDRDKIVLGEQVTLRLKLDGFNTRTSFIKEWQTLADSANHIQVVKRDNTDTVDVIGLTSYLQNITITSFDSGRWLIPIQPLIIQDDSTGKQTILKADTLFLQVLPVDVSGLKDYHDVKDIIDVPQEENYWFIIISAIIAIVIVILLVLILKRKKKPVTLRRQAVRINPLDDALIKIEELKKERPSSPAQIKAFYIKLDEICREYFNHRMQIQSLQSTSDEIIIKLNVYLQDKQAGTRFYQLLRLIDAVKFAKYIPAQQQQDEALVLAESSLRHIDQQLQLARHGN